MRSPTRGSDVWTPDSKELLFSSRGPRGFWHLFVVKAATGALTQLTDGAWDDSLPALSPDAKWIAFVSSRDGNAELYAMPPVIAVTALGSEGDRVDGLGRGADDYVVKPFSLRELLARIDAVIRRSAERPADIALLNVPGAQVDLARREVRYLRGGRSELSEKECELMGYLARNPGHAISRDELLQRIWKLEPSSVSTRAIDMNLARLRKKLGGPKGPSSPCGERATCSLWAGSREGLAAPGCWTARRCARPGVDEFGARSTRSQRAGR